MLLHCAVDIERNREMTKKQMRGIIVKLNKEKAKIAKARDNIRGMYEELADLVECFDAGIESLTIGIEHVENAVDHISEVV